MPSSSPRHKSQPRLPTFSTLPLLFRGAARKPAHDDLSTVYKQSSPSQAAQAHVQRPQSRAQHIPIPHVSNDKHQRALRGETGEREENVRESWGLQRARAAGIVRGRIGGMEGVRERERAKGKGNKEEMIDEEGGDERRIKEALSETESDLGAGAQNRDSDTVADTGSGAKYAYTPEQQRIRNETDTETSETQLARQLEHDLGSRVGDASETSRAPLSPKAKKEKRRQVSVRHVPLSEFLPEMGVRDEQWLQNLSESTELVDLSAAISPEDRGSGEENEGWRERDGVEAGLAVGEKKVEDAEMEGAKVEFKQVEAMEDDKAEREKEEAEKQRLKQGLKESARHSAEAEAEPSSSLKALRQEVNTEMHVDKDLPAIPQSQGGRRTERGETGSGLNVNKTLPPTPLASSPASGRLVWGFDDGEIVEDAKLRRTSAAKQNQQVDDLYTSIQALAMKIKEDRGAQGRSLASEGSEDVRFEASKDLGDHDEDDVDQYIIEKRTESSFGDKEVGTEVRLFRPTSLRVLEVANTVDPGTIPNSDLEEPMDREDKVNEDVSLGEKVAQNHREGSSNKDPVVEEGDVLQEIIDESDDGRNTEELLEDTTEETHEASLECTKTTSSNDEEKENPSETHDQGSRQFNGVSPETLEKVKAATEKLKAILREREQEQHGSIRQQKSATATTEKPRQVVTEKGASHSKEERDTVESESGVAAEQSSPENDIWAASTDGEDDEAKLLRRVVMNYA